MIRKPNQGLLIIYQNFKYIKTCYYEIVEYISD